MTNFRAFEPPGRRRLRWLRDGAVALAGATLGFGAVYLLLPADHGRDRGAPVARHASPPIDRPAPPPVRAAEPPRAFVAVPAAPPPRLVHRHGRGGWRRRQAAGDALARAYAEDALVTRRLNEAVMARLAARSGAPER